jgi:hypothetical protein
MRTLYFDCFNGAGGDMIVAALVDAGADADRLVADLRRLNVPGFAVRLEKVRKQGFAATRFVVDVDATIDQPHRHLSHICKILGESDLPVHVRKRARTAFERLADAEAEAHGIDREKVHFHEVGAVDAIVDVVGAMLALEQLAVQRIICSPLPVGSGTVVCAHGTMPVPAPATAILLRGVPIAATEETGELLTPTAAAVLTAVCSEFGPFPAMNVSRIGSGAGTREGVTRPNLLRAFVGDAAGEAEHDTVVVLEANLDDCPGEWIGHCLERLLAEGARDAYCLPIYMKKLRPGVVVTVICDAAEAARCESVLFAETTTFGIRRHTATRSVLARSHESVSTPYGTIHVKVGRRGAEVVQVAPEFDECAAAAKRGGVPLRVVMAAALDAWRAGNPSLGPL